MKATMYRICSIVPADEVVLRIGDEYYDIDIAHLVRAARSHIAEYLDWYTQYFIGIVSSHSVLWSDIEWAVESIVPHLHYDFFPSDTYLWLDLIARVADAAVKKASRRWNPQYGFAHGWRNRKRHDMFLKKRARYYSGIFQLAEWTKQLANNCDGIASCAACRFQYICP